MRRDILFLLHVLAVAGFSFAAHAATLYSIDVDTDELVRVSTGTGDVVIVGALGHDFQNDVDLAIFDNTLYALHTVFTVRVELAIINPADASIVSVDTVTVSGAPVTNAEGLTVIGGQLYAAFECEAPGPGFSNAIGELSLTGELSNVFDYLAFDPGADCDALTARSDGHLLWLDAEPGGINNYTLIDVELPPVPSYTVLGTHAPYRAINDLVSTGTNLWGINATDRNVVRLDPGNGGILETVPYNSPNRLLGLALASDAIHVGDGEPSVIEAAPWGLLQQNFPNPFIPQTTIRYRVQHPGDVRLSIFNGRGELVTMLVQGRQSPAVYDLQWDGRDSAGERVASGTYFYQLVVGDVRETRKLVILK